MKLLLSLPLTIILFYCSQAPNNNETQTDCEWCGANEAPDNTTSNTVIAGKNEAGERIKLTGTVYKSDGITPAENVVLYLYHTNAKGIYPRRGNEKGNGKRHGYLRGWIKTEANGKYSFETIKPAAYPGRTEPAHIHITVKEPNKPEYWLKSYLFEDDDLLTDKDRKSDAKGDRFYHVIDLRSKDDLMIGSRDIRLRN
ncbi:intradiol ring-cleavage dioxygenase [Ekhidna sp.]|jgi:protocatechuate 3,4-dioxygenase beta subunit|uniref:dioxygenase family protein n=1 Tax=Ekhidna sp. TaxID=2608089 RepID=UPI0032EB6C26